MDYSTMGIMDLWGLWRSGKIAEALELFEAIKSRDLSKIADELGDIAELFGLKGADLQLNELAAAIKAVEFKDIKSMTRVNRELLDVVDLLADKFAPVPVITTMADNFDWSTMTAEAMAPPHIADYTGAMARQWLADNRTPVRSAGKHLMVRGILNRRAPIVLSMMRGEATREELAAINPETLYKIIKFCRIAIPILTLAGAAFPPCLIAASVLKLIVAWYDANHPTSADATNTADKGLAPTDFLVAA